MSHVLLEYPELINTLKALEIDPSKRMADVERKNNLLELNW